MHFAWKTWFIIVLFHTLTYVSGRIETIVTKGTKFFYSNGTQFFIKGVAYQPPVREGEHRHYLDPLADPKSCDRDLPFFLELGINTLRIYTVDVKLDHTYCMNLFAKNGIYVLLDLSEPNVSIISLDPSWDVFIFWRYSQVIDVMHSFPNLLGLFAGNEVILDSQNTYAAPFVKAAIRDIKAYISSKGYRKILVGYAANDHEHTRIPSANYFACGDPNSAADFFGINIYEWCDPTTYETSGYKDRVNDFSHYNIPLFFSEFGCNIVYGKLGVRSFSQIPHIYSNKMTNVFSGGIVYEWFQNVNHYGLVDILNNGNVSPRQDYLNLKKQFSKINPTLVRMSDYNPTKRPPDCPFVNQHWQASVALPPIPNSYLCSCASSASPCIAVSDISENEIINIFAYVCDKLDCKSISKDGKTGIYGAYSVCGPIDKLNVVLGLYYNLHKQPSACNFGGSAYLRTPHTSKKCSSLLRVVGTDGTGRITGPPVATGHDTGKGTSDDESSGKNIYVRRKFILGMTALFIGIVIFITA